ncbi:MAG: squalene/phytoene synthase family protein [Hyphomicrobiaceae bacterium]
MAIGPRDPHELPAGEVIRLAARAYERDRYLAALLSPRAVRDDLIVIAAFAGEVARIPASVSEPMMGEIRLQWWRDALALETPSGHDATPSGHPVADAMRDLIERHDLDTTALNGLLDATARMLEDRPHRTERRLSATLVAIEGALFGAAMRVCAGRSPTAAEAAATMFAGEAYGLARVLVEAPILAGEGRSLLPGDDIVAPTERARSCLAEVRSGWRNLSRGVQCALLPVALVEPYLRLSKALDGERRAPDILPLARVWRLMAARGLGRI